MAPVEIKRGIGEGKAKCAAPAPGAWRTRLGNERATASMLNVAVQSDDAAAPRARRATRYCTRCVGRVEHGLSR
jgi:hypothetical protein